MEQKNFFQELKSDILKYVDLKLQYVKLSSFEKTARITSALSSFIIIAFLSFFGIGFLSLTLAVFLGSIFKSTTVGFALVATIYLVGLLFFIVFFRKKLENKISNLIIQILTDDE